MTLEEKIEEIVKHKLISINNANVVSVNDGFKQELLALIKEEAVKARLDELTRVLQQPYISQQVYGQDRIAELKAQQEEV